MPDERDELTRIRAFYAERDRRMADGASDEAPSVTTRFLLQQRQQAVLAMLRRHGLGSLGEATILDLGCGYGGVLQEYQTWGAAPARLHGIDLLLGRLRTARARLPGLPLTCADGQYLPYRSSVFDLVLQYTVFTSVLDDRVKANLAKEMLRVLRRPAGLILWYDFWINPTNRQTRAFGRPRFVACFRAVNTISNR
jgi:SAM-dependent methyltransferase